jgi:hypothetical protein
VGLHHSSRCRDCEKRVVRLPAQRIGIEHADFLSGFDESDVYLRKTLTWHSIWEENGMKIRILAGMVLALALAVSLAQDAVMAQRGGGGNKCSDVPVKWLFADEVGDKITSDLFSPRDYDGTLFSCASNDAVINMFKTNRKLNFDFSSPVSVSQGEAWMNSGNPVPVEIHVNVHKLGTIRSATPVTTFMTGQIEGPDRKTYRLRMTPLDVDTGLTPSPGDVNEPNLTSPVSVSFYSGTGCQPPSSCTNPYGKWEVVGRNPPTPESPYVQIGTVYKVLNTWQKVGQFQLPFKVTITAQAPLPALP